MIKTRAILRKEPTKLTNDPKTALDCFPRAARIVVRSIAGWWQ